MLDFDNSSTLFAVYDGHGGRVYEHIANNLFILQVKPPRVLYGFKGSVTQGNFFPSTCNATLARALQEKLQIT